MNLHTLLKSLSAAERKDLARRVGTSVVYLCQIQQCRETDRRPSMMMCARLIAASGGALTLHELRPDMPASICAAIRETMALTSTDGLPAENPT